MVLAVRVVVRRIIAFEDMMMTFDWKVIIVD